MNKKYSYNHNGVLVESDDLERFKKVLEALGVNADMEFYPSSSRGLVRYSDMSLEHLAYALRKRAMANLEGLRDTIRNERGLTAGKVLNMIVSPTDPIYQNLLNELYRRHKVASTHASELAWFKG